MKHFLLLLLVALTLISCSDDANPVSPGTSLQGDYFSPKKITVYTLNQTPEVYDFMYNSYGLVLSEVRDSTDRFLYTYNSHGNPLTKAHDFFYSGSWQNYDSTLYTYDTQNNCLRELVRSENQISSKKEYTYNSQNLKICETNWGRSMGQLVPYYRYNYNYIDTMKVSSTLEIYESGSWQYTDRSTFVYNESGRQDSILSESYYMNGWQKNSLLTHYFNYAGKITTQVFQVWGGSTWYNLFRTTNTYDTNQNLTFSMEDEYDWITEVWLPLAKRNIQYNSQKILSKVECFAYKNNSWQPVDNSLSLSNDHYSFNNYGYKMEVEYAGFFNSPSLNSKPGQTDSQINEMFERLVKEKMVKAKH